MKFLQLNFIPQSTDFALLVLRLWLGLTMLLNHGWDKLVHFNTYVGQFGDPIGIGPTASVALAVFAEVVASALLTLGLWTRFAALVLAVNMGVAFFIAHKHVLSGAGSGELAFIYLAGYVTILFAGGGSFALDRNLPSAGAKK